MVLEAATDLKLGSAYEPFSPFVFQPRGSCVSTFPKTGEYRMAIWAASNTKGYKNYSLGIGLAERDVMRIDNLIKADYNLFAMFLWGHWHPLALLGPILCAVLLTQILLFTSSIKVTLFKWLGTTGGAILLGHAMQNLMIVIWCMIWSHPGPKIWMALGLNIILPVFTGSGCIMASLIDTTGDICRRLTVGLLGAFHLFGWHCGYIVGPTFLIIASILPTVAADYVMFVGVVAAASTSSYIAIKK